MSRYITRKFINMLITLWVIITVVFFMVKVLPGSPFSSEKELPFGVFESLEKNYGLNKPLFVQYKDYLKNIVTFNLGNSYKYSGIKVSYIIKSAASYSIPIGVFTVGISFIMGVFLGVMASKGNRVIDDIVNIFSTLGIAVPNFVLAVVLIYLLGSKLNIIEYMDFSIKNYLWPVVILSVYPTAFIARIVKVNMVKTLKEDYIKTLKGYGLSNKKILFKYSLKNVMIPVITYISPMLASVMMGSFAIEKLFFIPGLGKFFIEGVISRDYSIIFGIMIFYAIIYLTAVFLADICYSLIDPHIHGYKYSKG